MATEHTTLLVSEPPDHPQSLPLTLLESVFQSLDKYSLAALCHMSRAVRNEAERILYRHVEFMWWHRKSFRLFHCTITSSQRLARYVRSISLSCLPCEPIIEILFVLTELRSLNVTLGRPPSRYQGDANGFISTLAAGCTFKLHTLISCDYGGAHFYDFLQSQPSLEVWVDNTLPDDELYTPASSALPPQISILEASAFRFCSAFSSKHLSYLRLKEFIFDKKRQRTQAQAVHALRACHSLVGLCLEQVYATTYEVHSELEAISDVLDAVPNLKYFCLLRPLNVHVDNYISLSKEDEHLFMLELVNSKLPRLDTFIFDTISPQSSELALKEDFALLSAGNLTLKRYICYREIYLRDETYFEKVECCKFPNGEVCIRPLTKFYNYMSWPDIVAYLEEGIQHVAKTDSQCKNLGTSE